MFTEKDLTAIQSHEFTIDLVRATLVQQVPTAPTTYTGPGSITQTAEGQLHLKMYCQFSSEALMDEFRDFGAGSSLQPGQLIGPENYFALEAVDLTGHVWRATDLWLNTTIGMTSSAGIVRSKLRRVENRINRDEASHSSSRRQKLVVVPGTHRFPFTRSQPNTLEPGFSACEFDLGDGNKCEIRTRGQSVVITTELPDVDPEDYHQRVIDALSLCVGMHLVPQVELTSTELFRSKLIRSVGKVSDDDPKLLPPIRTDSPHAFSGMQEFVQAYLRRIDQPFAQLAGYWYRVLTASHSGLENQALVWTTAIEGLLKTCFPNHGEADEDFVAQVEAAIPVVRALEIGTRARDRMLSTLGSAKGFAAPNALVALARERKIPGNLLKVWKRLRNKSAHAEELRLGAAESQAILNDLYACLELFYRLIMLHIGFNGCMVRYAVDGWNEESVDGFLPPAQVSGVAAKSKPSVPATIAADPPAGASPLSSESVPQTARPE